MATSFATQATAQEIKRGEFLCPILVTVNDRAATREAIIKGVRAMKATFVERSSWKALYIRGRVPKGKFVPAILEWCWLETSEPKPICSHHRRHKNEQAFNRIDPRRSDHSLRWLLRSP